MNWLRSFCGLATVVLLLLAGAPGANAQGRGAAPDLALGERVYQQRCASCHDGPTGRTPSRVAIGDNTPNFVISTLREGIMRPMAEGLGWPEIVGVAAFVAKRPGGDVDTTALEAPLCSEPPKPLTLDEPNWNGWGDAITQHRFQPNPGFTVAEAPRLKLKWAMDYTGGRNGQATVVGGRLYFNSSSGAIYSLDARTGCAHWRFNAEATSRSSIVIGPLPAASAPARFAAYFTDWTKSAYAIDAETGKLLWKTQVDAQNGVQMTGSPVLHDGVLFVPVSSAEEAIATNDDYACCQFRGSLVALDAVTGRLLWKVYTTTRAPRPFRKNAKGVQMWGPAGGAIWSAPTIDAGRGLVYVATGDSYTDVEYDGSDAVMAFEAKTGRLAWSHQLTKADNYIIGCYPPKPPANCPTKVGPDHDFGASPILHTLPGGKQVILAGQKSSEVYALDPDNKGALLWKQRLSPGGVLGGVEFSIAADDSAVYVPIVDIFTRDGGRPGLSALNISDGTLRWTAPSPQLPCHWSNSYCHPGLSQAISVAPGMVFAAAMNGRFRAYDAQTGKVIWEYDTGAAPVRTVLGREARGSVMDGAGPTIAGGMVYVHTGYQSRSGAPGTVLMAFSVDGK